MAPTTIYLVKTNAWNNDADVREKCEKLALQEPPEAVDRAFTKYNCQAVCYLASLLPHFAHIKGVASLVMSYAKLDKYETLIDEFLRFPIYWEYCDKHEPLEVYSVIPDSNNNEEEEKQVCGRCRQPKNYDSRCFTVLNTSTDLIMFDALPMTRFPKNWNEAQLPNICLLCCCQLHAFRNTLATWEAPRPHRCPSCS